MIYTVEALHLNQPETYSFLAVTLDLWDLPCPKLLPFTLSSWTYESYHIITTTNKATSSFTFFLLLLTETANVSLWTFLRSWAVELMSHFQITSKHMAAPHSISPCLIFNTYSISEVSPWCLVLSNGTARPAGLESGNQLVHRYKKLGQTYFRALGTNFWHQHWTIQQWWPSSHLCLKMQSFKMGHELCHVEYFNCCRRESWDD